MWATRTKNMSTSKCFVVESFMEQNLFIKRHLTIVILCTKNKNKYINIYIIKTCFVAVKMYFQIRQAYYETYHQNPKNSPTLFFGWKYVGVNFVKRIIFLGVVCW